MSKQQLSTNPIVPSRTDSTARTGAALAIGNAAAGEKKTPYFELPGVSDNQATRGVRPITKETVEVLWRTLCVTEGESSGGQLTTVATYGCLTMKHGFLSGLASRYAITPAAAAQLATDVLRELHRVSIIEGSVQLGALDTTRFEFGEEAAYHLGGLIIEGGDDDHSRLWTEVMDRSLGMNGYLYWPKLAEWLAQRSAIEEESEPASSQGPVVDLSGNGATDMPQDTDAIELLRRRGIKPALHSRSAVGWCSYVPTPHLPSAMWEEVCPEISEQRVVALKAGALPSYAEQTIWNDRVFADPVGYGYLFLVVVWRVSQAGRDVYAAVRFHTPRLENHSVGIFESIDQLNEALLRGGRMKCGTGILANSQPRTTSISQNTAESPAASPI